MKLSSAYSLPYPESDFFSLDISCGSASTHITMRMLVQLYNTATVPETSIVLKKNLPSILRSKCFNDKNYNFSREVDNTEMGHLFEHIILEHLSITKISHGYKNYIHSGFTEWNWIKDERGLFHISIDIGKKESAILYTALCKSINLINQILLQGVLRQKTENNNLISTYKQTVLV